MEDLKFWGETILTARNDAKNLNGQIQDTLESMLTELEEHAEEGGSPIGISITKVGDVFNAAWELDLGNTRFRITAREVTEKTNESEYNPDTGGHIIPNRELPEVLGKLIMSGYTNS